MTDDTHLRAQRATVALLTARLHDDPISDSLVEEWALSADLEPVRLTVGDTLLNAGLAWIARAVESEFPGSRRGATWHPDAAERFTEMLYGAFGRVPPPFGDALCHFDAAVERSAVVAGELATDYPAAMDAALQNPPDGPLRALIIEAHYLGFGARPHDRYAWLNSAVTVTLSQLCEVGDRIGVDPGEELARWGLRAA